MDGVTELFNVLYTVLGLKHYAYDDDIDHHDKEHFLCVPKTS